jgi:uncharacterized membrane-anchored protein
MTYLPTDAPQRALIHNEVHTRPSAHIQLPALTVLVAVFNDEVSVEQEYEHLRLLAQNLSFQEMQSNFVRLDLGTYTLKWERHTEFTRYSLVQPFPCNQALPGSNWLDYLHVAKDWLTGIPGQTFAAIEIAMLHHALDDLQQALVQAKTWLGTLETTVASCIGKPLHSMVATDFTLRDSGFERMVVLALPATNTARAGRISQRLLEFEVYRLMALRGLPVAKMVGQQLNTAERTLANITAALDNKSTPDQALLDQLVSLAATIELMTAEHAYRFSATAAYDKLVHERIADLRESPIAGTQTIGQFMQRRLSPAMATVASTNHRLTLLSERISRTSSLLRTRVDIATEWQNHQLLEKLTKGQQLQLRLQTTVEGLSIAAISYYVVSLLLYLGKAGKAAGLPIAPELFAGVCIPLVVYVIWYINRRIHSKIYIHR